MKPIKLLNIHWGFSIGGVGKYASSLDDVSRYSPIEPYSVCILSPDWHCDRETLNTLRAKEIVIKSRLDFSWFRKIIAEVDRVQPDIIMTHGFNGHFVSLVTLRFCKTKSIRICSYHGRYHAPSKLRKLATPFLDGLTEYYINHIADSAVAVAQCSKDYLVSCGISPKKIRVIHNGIDENTDNNPDARQNIRSEWGIGEKTTLLGIASRLDPIKGLPYLIEAVLELLEDGRDIKLALIGTGPLEDDLRGTVSNTSFANRFIFTGFRSDIPDCLEALDFFILPSLEENHSIALLEAMRAAKTIIATDVGGNGESVRHEKEALLVPSANSAALKSAIERLLSSPDLAETLAYNAKTRFNENFRTERMVRKTAAWIVDSMDKKNKQ